LAKPSGLSLANGNLDGSGSAIQGSAVSTIFPNSGKWYAEYTCTTPQNDTGAGVASTQINPFEDWFGEQSYTVGYLGDGRIMQSGSTVVSGSSFTTNDVIGIAFDVDTGKVWFAKNNTWQNSGDPAAGTGQCATISDGNPLGVTFRSVGGAGTFNFGQRPFAYTAPSGFKALVTTNLPAPTVLQGDAYFNTVLYTGNGSTQTISGLDFSPDFVWIKKRNSSSFGSHQFVDQVRGETKYLFSDSTNAETTAADRLTAFNSDGFDLSTASQVNNNTDTYVAWNWDAGGSNATNTDGTITSTVRANTTAGFSIVSYTATGVNNDTVGHGLGVIPDFYILKSRDAARNWLVYTQKIDGSLDFLQLNTTAANTNSSANAPTSSVFSIYGVDTNTAGEDCIAYVFAAIPNFSAFGKYTGNGSTDGPFVYTGFRPAWILFKSASNSSTDWIILDVKRSTYNVVNLILRANTAGAEQTDSLSNTDFLSNGFKLKGSGAYGINQSGTTFIYAAFAENPFKYALAR
jgi:hypothetical protein